MDDLKSTLASLAAKKLKNPGNPHLHSELHALVEEVRSRFGETAKVGPGSFGFYLGFFKRLGVDQVRRLLKEIDEGSPTDPKRLFWWKVKEQSNQSKKSDQNG